MRVRHDAKSLIGSGLYYAAAAGLSYAVCQIVTVGVWASGTAVAARLQSALVSRATFVVWGLLLGVVAGAVVGLLWPRRHGLLVPALAGALLSWAGQVSAADWLLLRKDVLSWVSLAALVGGGLVVHGLVTLIWPRKNGHRTKGS